jgi:hypothetical protein
VAKKLSLNDDFHKNIHQNALILIKSSAFFCSRLGLVPFRPYYSYIADFGSLEGSRIFANPKNGA